MHCVGLDCMHIVRMYVCMYVCVYVYMYVYMYVSIVCHLFTAYLDEI